MCHLNSPMAEFFFFLLLEIESSSKCVMSCLDMDLDLDISTDFCLANRSFFFYISSASCKLLILLLLSEKIIFCNRFSWFFRIHNIINGLAFLVFLEAVEFYFAEPLIILTLCLSFLWRPYYSINKPKTPKFQQHDTQIIEFYLFPIF